MEISDIKRLRKRFNLTQSELAREARVSQSLIAKIESGRIDPTFSKVQSIFSVLAGLSEREEPKAGQYMVRKIITVRPEDKLNNAIKVLKAHQISQMPVMRENQVVGLLSEKGILEFLLKGEDINQLKVESVMEEAPPVVSQKTPLRIIMDLLQYAPLVVISEGGSLKGVITKADVMKAK